jgi:hypothetical protein
MVRRFSVRIIAFVLILTFTQRLGMNLWVHHWYHEAKGPIARDDSDQAQWQSRCDCVDDAFMPLVAADPFVFNTTRTSYESLTVPYLPRLSSIAPLVINGRGPPASLAHC